VTAALATGVATALAAFVTAATAFAQLESGTSGELPEQLHEFLGGSGSGSEDATTSLDGLGEFADTTSDTATSTSAVVSTASGLELLEQLGDAFATATASALTATRATELEH
jgi:hypothetical protein